MSKKLNENNIVNELKGRSLFFPLETQTTSDSSGVENARSSSTEELIRSQPDPTTPSASVSISAPQPPSQMVRDPKKSSGETKSPSPLWQNHPLASPPNAPESKARKVEEASPNGEGTLEDPDLATQASPRASQGASVPASTLAQYDDDLIQEIRKTVKAYGKEVSYVRLTPEEKKLLAEIAYTYKSQGVKTSENEINRIAVNFLLMDYASKGQESILSRVIEALLA